MPRKANPRNEYQRNATAKSRAKLAARPEADYVDTAISAAFYAHVIGTIRTGGDTTTINFIRSVAEQVLLAWPGKTFDPAEVQRKVFQRVCQRTPEDRSRFFAAARAVKQAVKAANNGPK